MEKITEAADLAGGEEEAQDYLFDNLHLCEKYSYDFLSGASSTREPTANTNYHDNESLESAEWIRYQQQYLRFDAVTCESTAHQYEHATQDGATLLRQANSMIMREQQNYVDSPFDEDHPTPMRIRLTPGPRFTSSVSQNHNRKTVELKPVRGRKATPATIPQHVKVQSESRNSVVYDSESVQVKYERFVGSLPLNVNQK